MFWKKPLNIFLLQVSRFSVSSRAPQAVRVQYLLLACDRCQNGFHNCCGGKQIFLTLKYDYGNINYSNILMEVSSSSSSPHSTLFTLQSSSCPTWSQTSRTPSKNRLNERNTWPRLSFMRPTSSWWANVWYQARTRSLRKLWRTWRRWNLISTSRR